MTKQIKLSRGEVALVDDADFEWLNQYRWYEARGYAVRSESHSRKKVLMHRQILGLADREIADHADGNKLNNQRYNLRKCNPLENSRNRRPNPFRKYKGVFSTSMNQWESMIAVNGESIFIGRFDTMAEAARAYDEAAQKYFCEFAWLNFPDAHEPIAIHR